MTDQTTEHNVDVGVRALVMQAARARLAAIRLNERATTGAPRTTMADVGRSIMNGWTPEKTATQTDDEGTATDDAGNKITERGHRKFLTHPSKVLPGRTDDDTDQARAEAVRRELRKLSLDKGRLTIPKLNELERVVKHEKLGDIVVEDVTMNRWLARTRRDLLPPFRFTMPKHAYTAVFERMRHHNTTVTRALEAGLERFAQTGEY